MNELGSAIHERFGAGGPLPGHTHGQVSIARSPPPRIQQPQPPAATAAPLLYFSRDRSLATDEGPATTEDHRTKREEKRVAHGSLLLRLSSPRGAFPRSGSEGLTPAPRSHLGRTPNWQEGVWREREGGRVWGGNRWAGSCVPALRVENRPRSQTHGRHAGSGRECESAAERTRIVDLLKPDHDWVAVARFGNRRNSAAARGRWRALQDERERRRREAGRGLSS